VADDSPTAASGANEPSGPIESNSPSNIPLPTHGFESLDQLASEESGAVPAVEIISRAAVLLMNASAEKLGLATTGEPDIDLDEARKLITSLAGLVAAAQGFLGIHRQPLRDGVRTLQAAFREASSYPDEPGQGPGEQLLS
jgi:Domain of unknown function (DUF1844)